MGEEENEIPDSGAVFTFGRSRFADNLPSHFFIRNDPVVDISCGDEHTLVVCQNGRVFGFGGNEFGQLGLGTTSAVSKPSCIKSLKPEKVKRIVCGRTHSLALTGSGKLYAWGNNCDCQLGTGNEENSATPKQVELKDMTEPIANITAGDQHSALLTDGGKVYMWGSNSCGQLGLSDGIKKCSKPTLLPVKEKVLQIACGYLHTLMLTEDKYLLVFGEGKSGKLGLGGTSSVPIPIPLKFDKNVRCIAAGGSHSLALTDEGDVYAWGDNEHGQLGFSEEKAEITNPILVTPLLNVRVAQIACGDRHSAFISDNGELYTCGESKYGKLCSDSELKSDIMGSRTLPFKVNRFKALKVQKVSCGGCQTMVLALPSNRQKQGTMNGCIDKTNKENELAKKAISETSIEVLSDISSTPRKASSRTSLPPLQKVVPKIEPELSDLQPVIPNLKQTDEEKLNGDGNHHENGTNEEIFQENSADTTETPKEEYIMNEEIPENGETVSNDGSDASNNKELSDEKDDKVDPAGGLESANINDNVSTRFTNKNIRRILLHKNNPETLEIQVKSRNRKSTLSLHDDKACKVLSENHHEFIKSLPCFDEYLSQKFGEMHDKFSKIYSKGRAISSETNYGIPKCIKPKELKFPCDGDCTHGEKVESMVIGDGMYNHQVLNSLDIDDIDVKENGKLFSRPRENMQSLLAFRLNRPQSENIESSNANEDGERPDQTCQRIAGKNSRLMQSILYNSWTRCNKINQSMEDLNNLEELENIKLEVFFNGEDDYEDGLCIGEEKLCEIISEASRDVEKFCEETKNDGNENGEMETFTERSSIESVHSTYDDKMEDSGTGDEGNQKRDVNKSTEGSSIGSSRSKLIYRGEGSIEDKVEQNYDFVCECEKTCPNNGSNDDYFAQTNASPRSSEFEYFKNRKLNHSSISCPDYPLKFEENNLKTDEQKMLNKSIGGSMTYLSQTNNLRRKIFVENEYARSNFTMDSISNVDENEEDEFDLVINCKKFEIENNHCVEEEEEDEVSFGSGTFFNLSTVKDVTSSKADDEFSNDSLNSRRSLKSCSRFHQCRLCGSMLEGKDSRGSSKELRKNLDSRKGTSSIMSSIRSNLRTIVQRTKNLTSNYYKCNMVSKAISKDGCSKQDKCRSEVFANEAYDNELTIRWTNEEESENSFEKIKEDSKLDENWGECCLKLIFKGDKAEMMVSEDIGSAADMSSTVSVVSPASERKAETTDSAKSHPDDEIQIQEDTKTHQEEAVKSETEVSETKDEAKSENSKEKGEKSETKNKSPKQKEKNKGSKKQTSSVCTIL